MAQDLHGIDNPHTAESIRRDALAKGGSFRRIVRVVLWVLGMSSVGGVACLFFRPGSPWSFVIGSVALPVIVTLVINRLHARELEKALPDELRSGGRCANCGYDLQGGTGELCPECGMAPERKHDVAPADGVDRVSDSS